MNTPAAVGARFVLEQAGASWSESRDVYEHERTGAIQGRPGTIVLVFMRDSWRDGFLRVVVGLVVALSAVVPSASVLADPGFSDLDEASPHRAGVENLQELGILEGTECARGEFCPADALQRWVMAVWLVRVLDSADPDPSSTRFADVDPDEWWAPYVERLAVLGVTQGCATEPARFCPDDSVTRGQMATFLSRAFDLEAASSFGFTDVGGNTHEHNIDALAATGVTVGCATGPVRYCPDQSVTRGQMATFLTRAIGTGPLAVEIDSSTSGAVSGSFQLDITFARPMTGLDRRDLVVVNGDATRLTGSGSTYQATIAPAARGSVVVWIPDGVARDGTGRSNRRSGLVVRTFGSDAYGAGPGFDTWDRDAMLAAYRAEFEREEPDPGFTGNVDDCKAGTTSQTYRDSVVQRVNWYRQMAGLDTVTERSAYSAAAQSAALMMSAQRSLSHDPGTDWACYTSEGASGAGMSNLGLGNSGTSGIDSYMRDSGSNNLSVGHRRWILHPQLLRIGTGNIPRASSHRGANALHVIDTNVHADRPDVREPRGFVAWPPSGYLPPEAVWGRWSFQIGGADFGSATVRVADDHGPVLVEIIARLSARGAPEASIVWAVHGDGGSREFPTFPDSDYCYTVTVSRVKIGGAVQTPYQYATCLIDPGTEDVTGSLYLSPPVWSPDGDTIAYVRDGIAYVRDGRTWTVSAGGADHRLFLLSGTMRWSRDGTRIAYGSGNGIWTVNSDGAGPQQLTTSGAAPVWSPDGAKIAYVNRGIWVMNSDGAGPQQLTTSGAAPVWSPDGAKIAYVNRGIWVMNADGANPQQLTGTGSSPAWSRDSTRIAYGIAYGSGNGIWTVNADGTNPQQLTTSGSSPAWSPDGTRIAYGNGNGIWTVNADGTNPQQLTTSGSSPAWSPDGAKIAYNESGHQLWVIDADGTNQQQLNK